MLRIGPTVCRRRDAPGAVPSSAVTNIASAPADVAAVERGKPTHDELVTWRSFLRAHARITRALEAELIAEQRLSLASYDVLVQLAEAPERCLRMTELAEAVLLSRSGVTRVVDRLERAGLVSRSRVENDGRGVAAQLTAAGLNRLRRASGTHLDGVVRHFAVRLEAEDLVVLDRISRRLAD